MYAGCAALASTLIAALFPRSDACEVVSLDRKWLGAQTDGLKARGHWQGQDEGIFSFTREPLWHMLPNKFLAYNTMDQVSFDFAARPKVGFPADAWSDTLLRGSVVPRSEDVQQ